MSELHPEVRALLQPSDDLAKRAEARGLVGPKEAAAELLSADELAGALRTRATITSSGSAQPIVEDARPLPDADTILSRVRIIPVGSDDVRVGAETALFDGTPVPTAYGTAAQAGDVAWTDALAPSVWIPASFEIHKSTWEDVGARRDFLANSVARAIDVAIEKQVIAGNGTAPNLSGIEDQSSINAQAFDTDVVTSILRGAGVVRGKSEHYGRNGQYVVLNPADADDVAIAAVGKANLATALEILDVRGWHTSASVSAGSAIVGALDQVSVYLRSGLTVEVSPDHSTFFTEGKIAVLASVRLSLFVRGAAFAQVALAAA